ncbi:hypothetical protein [Streptomyces sp. NPDC094049]|uniref:hypothetical protein n=1 Tax=Streptomyces sp. NPDC094049 TaxID=3154987 RepID=UPI0033216D06
MEETFLAALAARPPDEGLAEAVRRTAEAAGSGLGDGAAWAVPVALYLRAPAVVDSTPELHAAGLLRAAVFVAGVGVLAVGQSDECGRFAGGGRAEGRAVCVGHGVMGLCAGDRSGSDVS